MFLLPFLLAKLSFECFFFSNYSSFSMRSAFDLRWCSTGTGRGWLWEEVCRWMDLRC